MDIQYVGGKTASVLGQLSGNLDVPLTDLSGGLASSPSQNDIVIVAFSIAGENDLDKSIQTSGYTRLCDLYSNDSSDTNLWVSYKIMGLTPDSTVSVPYSGNEQQPLTIAIQVWRGINTTTPLDVTSTTATGQNTGQPTPPAITPTTSGAIIVCVGAGAYTSSANYTTATLSNFITTIKQDTFDSMIGMGSYAWSSGTYTPATFGGGSTSTSASWAGFTLALRPFVESGPANLKTINGLAKASVKTVNGLAIASIKSFNGLI